MIIPSRQNRKAKIQNSKPHCKFSFPQTLTPTNSHQMYGDIYAKSVYKSLD